MDNLFVFITVLALFGFFTGMLSGLLGVGGGIVMVPFLALVVGLPQDVSQATSLAVVLPTSLVGVWTLWRRNFLPKKEGLTAGLFGMIFAVAGVFLAFYLEERSLRMVFAVVLAIVSIRMFVDAVRKNRKKRSEVTS